MKEQHKSFDQHFRELLLSYNKEHLFHSELKQLRDEELEKGKIFCGNFDRLNTHEESNESFANRKIKLLVRYSIAKSNIAALSTLMAERDQEDLLIKAQRVMTRATLFWKKQQQMIISTAAWSILYAFAMVLAELTFKAVYYLKSGLYLVGGLVIGMQQAQGQPSSDSKLSNSNPLTLIAQKFCVSGSGSGSGPSKSENEAGETKKEPETSYLNQIPDVAIAEEGDVKNAIFKEKMLSKFSQHATAHGLELMGSSAFSEIFDSLISAAYKETKERQEQVVSAHIYSNVNGASLSGLPDLPPK